MSKNGCVKTKGLGRRVWTETDAPIGVESEQTQIEKKERLNKHSCKEEASELNRQRERRSFLIATEVQKKLLNRHRSIGGMSEETQRYKRSFCTDTEVS
jgi:hypothetical protein